MNDDWQELDQPLRHAHTHSYVGTAQAGAPPLRLAGAPPLRLAGADDEAAVSAEPHIVRGID
ncbi:hypothetical protein AB0454_24520 [Streptomyces sp. NPDC093509]|uniref:hypothetical protein n=1 Tax=Streptomyces sp. NPDC093509 TaxID=3154982 RepID=UPI00344F8A96